MVRDAPAAFLLAALERREARDLRRSLTVGAWLTHDTGDASGGVHRGRRRVVRRLLALVTTEGLTPRRADVNGTTGIALVASDGAVRGVLAFDTARRRVRGVWACTAAEKLRGWQAGGGAVTSDGAPLSSL